MRRSLGSRQPIIRRNDGTTTRWNVTAALTGFPGRANTSIFFPRASFFNLTSANVSGFPGFIITLPK